MALIIVQRNIDCCIAAERRSHDAVNGPLTFLRAAQPPTITVVPGDTRL